jgi:hypothetical protein
MRLAWVTTLVLALGAVACGGSREGTRGDTAAASTLTSDDAGSGGSGGSGAAGGMASTVTLTGGKHAGTYRRESREATCIDYGSLGLGAADFSQETKGLTAVDFGTKSKSAEGTDDFSLTVSFADGDVLSTTHYRLDPRKQHGSGTAKVTGSAPRYTVEVTGKTAEGVAIQVTIRCLG